MDFSRGQILQIIYGSEKNPKSIEGIVIDDLDSKKVLILNLIGEIATVKRDSILSTLNIEPTMDEELVVLLKAYNKEYEGQKILERKVEDLKRRTNLRNGMIAEKGKNLFNLKQDIKTFVKTYKLSDLVYLYNNNTKILEDIVIKNITSNIVIECENELNNTLINDEILEYINSKQQETIDKIEKIAFGEPTFSKFDLLELYSNFSESETKLLSTITVVLMAHDSVFYKDDINFYLNDLNSVIDILNKNKIKDKDLIKQNSLIALT